MEVQAGREIHGGETNEYEGDGLPRSLPPEGLPDWGGDGIGFEYDFDDGDVDVDGVGDESFGGGGLKEGGSYGETVERVDYSRILWELWGCWCKIEWV